MIRYLMMAILLVFSLVTYPKKKASNTRFNETYRNQFHFSPETNKMGSPIAIWMNDSVYYFYYQYNPHNLQAAYINWGLTTSTDLLHWQHQPCVIEQPSSISDSMFQTPWWGAIHATENGITAWLNRWGDGLVGMSSDNGVQFVNEKKLTGTDHLSKSEPYVFWYQPKQIWVMLAYNRPDKTMHILNSSDGTAWTETSKFNYNYGFPQLVELPVDRKEDDTRWVLFTESGTYMVCDFDGKELKIETTVKQLDYGRNTGGTILFNDHINERVISISEIKSQQLADIASNGTMSFPSAISLHKATEGFEIRHQPISEIENLTDKPWVWEARKVYPGINNNPLKKVKGNELYVKGTISNVNSDQFGFMIRTDKTGKGTEISYNVKRDMFTVGNTQFSYKSTGQTMQFEILIDRSVIELYLDEGRYVCRTPFSPTPNATGYELFTSGGEIMIDSLIVVPLGSIW